MCGRFLLNEDSLIQAESIAVIPAWIQEKLRFGEIFPSMPSLVLKQAEKTDSLEGAILNFGYVYGQKKQRIINARAETVDSKWMFRQAYAKNRVAVVCSAFYEWDADKQKIRFFQPGKTLYLAALAIEDSFVILTREASADVAPWHHRMPVVLEENEVARWVFDPACSKKLMSQEPPVLDHAQAGIRHGQPSLF